MHFKITILKILRGILFPFAVIYGTVIHIRNYLFDRKILRSTSFDLPTICVGNLAVGGTGKTPMIEYLIRLLSPHYRLATLSRGYGRRSKGFVQADHSTSATIIGDEPAQLFSKFNGITVAVDEDRVDGVRQLLQLHPRPQLILLDDALQHRRLSARINILLTDYSHPYWADCFLPTGNLRDQKSSAKRAQIIIVTKCPKNFSTKNKQSFLAHIHAASHQQVFFSTIAYQPPYHYKSFETIDITASQHILLVTGIANPENILAYYKEKNITIELIQYKDHHIFTAKDLSFIKEKFENIKNRDKLVLATEKDAVKLVNMEGLNNSDLPLYILPVQMEILLDEAQRFAITVLKNVRS